MHFVCFAFLKLSKLEMFFSEARFYIWMKGKRDLATSSNSNGECYEKNSSETRRSMTETGKFYIKNTPITQPRSFFFLAGSSLWLPLGTSSSSFFLYHFLFQLWNKTKATNFTKHRREPSLLHKLSHKCLKPFDFIILL